MPDTRKPRVLVVTRNLPPLLGGMERLNWHMVDELSRFAVVRVVGPEGAASQAPAGVELLELPLRPLWLFLVSAQWRAFRQARSWKPHVVLAGSGLTAPLAWLAARACHATAAVYVHGLDISVPHPLYRRAWLPFLRRMDRVIANSRSTARLAELADCPADRIAIVHPGVSLNAGAADPAAVMVFRKEHGLDARPLLLSVGRLTRRKGLREFVSEALPRIVARQPDVLLVVVGDAPIDALHAAGQTRESIEAAAANAGVHGNLLFIGHLSEAQLIVAYEAAAVHVFPVRHIEGDPEGFGMVAIEAAAQALPTVAFASGGVIDAVADRSSGRLIAEGDHVAFAEAVVEILSEPEAMRSSCRKFAERFAWPSFGDAIASQLFDSHMRSFSRHE